MAPSDDANKVRVAGPQDARPVRELPAGRVIDLLETSRSLATREAASFLAREFSRLEEAVVIVEGSLEAILGDQVVTLGEGDTVLAPAGVKHGFENRSGATARLLAIFPKTQFERVPME